MNEETRMHYAKVLVDSLDQFEDEVGAQNSRVLYALILGKVFGRYIDRFGLKSAQILLRNLYRNFHRAEVVQARAAQNAVTRAAGRAPGDTSPPPPSSPGAPEA